MKPYPLENYGEAGLAAPIQVLPTAEAEALAAKVLAAEATEAGAQALRSFAHLQFPWLYDLATHERVLDAVETVLGPDLLIWAAEFFIKPAQSGSYISWHQDSTYGGLEPATITTAWIALTPSVEESGCLMVAPGTHKMAQLPHADSFAADNLLSRGQEVQVDVSTLETTHVELEPGQMSLHHVQLVHGSEPNRASWPRLGFAVRFIPTSVRQRGGRTLVVLARGEDRFGHFDLAPRPEADLTPEAVAIAADAQARLKAITMPESA